MSESNIWLRHELPAPIALPYLVYERESVPNQRLWKMYELVEASLSYLSLVLLGLLYQSIGTKTSQRLARSGIRVKRLSMGGWRALLNKLPGMIAGSGVRSTFARACQRAMAQNQEFLDAIGDARNRSAHDGPQSARFCAVVLDEFHPLLQAYLESLYFLRNNSLVKVANIKKRGETYFHYCVHYVGDTSIFPTIEIPLLTPLDSDVLWMLGDDEIINLHPLILTTPDDKMGENVWLYQEITHSDVVYKNYGTGRISKNGQFLHDIQAVVGK